MKKFLCLTLAVLMATSLFGCCCCNGSNFLDDDSEDGNFISGSEDDTAVNGDTDDIPAETRTFQVGFGRTNITPDSPMPLDGYGQSEKRLHSFVLDHIYATCVAITDENGETILLLSVDVTDTKNYATILPQISQATGVPEDHILLAATHTHSSVDQSSDLASGWLNTFYQKCVEAAEIAMADRSDAEIYIGSAQTQNMNFVRHYLMKDGTYSGNGFGSLASGYLDHASANDPELQVIKFTRGESSKDIIMVNWQGHPSITGGATSTDLSADYVGGTRNYIEQQTEDHFIYFLGASGNQDVKTNLPGEPAPPADPFAFGIALGDVILGAMENMAKMEDTAIRTTRYTFEGDVDHSGDHLLREARSVVVVYANTDRATANVLANELGLSSVYHANSIISKSEMPSTENLELNAISVGDLAFAGVPYEMFADHGMYIKENSPAAMTFIITCCNGTSSYIPTEFAYDYQCYESLLGHFARGTGETLAQTYVELLNAHRAG